MCRRSLRSQGLEAGLGCGEARDQQAASGGRAGPGSVFPPVKWAWPDETSPNGLSGCLLPPGLQGLVLLSPGPGPGSNPQSSEAVTRLPPPSGGLCPPDSPGRSWRLSGDASSSHPRRAAGRRWHIPPRDAQPQDGEAFFPPCSWYQRGAGNGWPMELGQTLASQTTQACL